MKFTFFLVFLFSFLSQAAHSSFERQSLNDLSVVVVEINSKLPDNYCAPSKMVALKSGEVTSQKLSTLLNEAAVENVALVKRGFDLALSTMATLVDMISYEEKAEAVGTKLISSLVNKVQELQLERGVEIYKFFMPDYYAHTEIGGLVILDTVANQALIVSFPFCP